MTCQRHSNVKVTKTRQHKKDGAGFLNYSSTSIASSCLKMGCKFSKIRFFRRKRSKSRRDNEEAVGHLKTRNRREITDEHQPATDERGEQRLRDEAIDKETVNILVEVGLEENIANELVLRRKKGRLESTKDIVAVLEENNKKYQLHLNENILVRVNSMGELSCQKFGEKTREEQPQRNKINSEDKININTASRKALEAIKGIGPTIADRIIQYRQEYGPFTKVEDIVLVRGVSEKLLEKITSQITVDSSKTKSNEVQNGEKNRTSANKKIPRFSPDDGTVRIASWNLLSFSSDKADNVGVREVICCTILENGIDILAVQEIGDDNALNKIKDELNNPTIEAVKNWKTRGLWECCTSDVAGYMFRSREYNGFLWNASKPKGIKLKSNALLEKPKEGQKQFARRPYLGFFEAKKFDFVLVSVHLKAAGLGNSDIERLEKELNRVPNLVEALKKHIPGEKDMIILGDFNLGPEENEFDAMRKGRLENVIPGSTFTNISTKNMQGSKNYDNIWISRHAKLHHFTGQAGVIRDGLTHPYIPNGWLWDGLVSDHCPVWAEFYCDRDFDRVSGHVTVEDITIDGKQTEE